VNERSRSRGTAFTFSWNCCRDTNAEIHADTVRGIWMIEFSWNCTSIYLCICISTAMGWLRFVGSLKWQVFFATEPYKRDYILQKRPLILRSLLIVATPCRDETPQHHQLYHVHVNITNSTIRYIESRTLWSKFHELYQHISLHSYLYSNRDETPEHHQLYHVHVNITNSTIRYIESRTLSAVFERVTNSFR